MSDHHKTDATDRFQANRTDVHLHLHGVEAMFAPFIHLLERIFHKLERIETMSGTLAEQLAAAQAATTAALDAVATDVTEISADVDRLLAGMTTGTTITQQMVDDANSIATRVAGIKTSLDDVNAKGGTPPTP